MLVSRDHQRVATDHRSERDHCQTEPSRGRDSFHRLGMNRHHEVGHGGVVRNLGLFRDASQYSSGGFVQDERIDHAELDTDQNQEDTSEEISISIQ